MGEVQWIKIIPELFDDDKIQLIESMPEGDTILVIWFKLLCFAGKKNNGGVFMVSEKKPYDAKMFATVFHRPVETVELALDTFESFGMVEIIKHTYTIANWEKHQNIDGLDKIREQNRERKRQQRERQKKVLSEDSRDSHVTVTDGHATEEEREEEKEKELHSIIPSMRDEAKLKLLGGSLCQRIIMMSDEQFDDLCDRLSFDEFNKYVSIIVECEKKGKHYKKKSHYQAILDMVAKDRKVKGGA